MRRPPQPPPPMRAARQPDPLAALRGRITPTRAPTPRPKPAHPAAADAGGRRQTRSRKVSTKLAVVDAASRAQAVAARLDALENDNNEAADPFGLAADDDDEFVIASDGEEGAPAGPGGRRLRGIARRAAAPGARAAGRRRPTQRVRVCMPRRARLKKRARRAAQRS